MRVYFNDLTLSDNAQADTALIPEFVKVLKGFKAMSKCVKLIADEDGMAGLHSILSLLPHCKKKKDGKDKKKEKDEEENYENDKDYLVSQVVMAFQKSDGEDGDEFAPDDLDFHKKHIFVYRGSDGKEYDAKMMGWAALNHSLTIGLFSRLEWRDLHHTITEGLEDDSPSRDVMCVTQQRHNVDKDVLKWIEIIKEAETVIGLDDSSEKQIRGKIVVIGVHDRNPLLDVAKRMRFSLDCFEFLETGDMQRYDCEIWKNNKNVAAIMVGAIPHSIKGLGDYNSLLDKLNCEKEKYPPFVKLQNEIGELKCTKNSFAKGLDSLFKNERFKEQING